MIDLVDLCSSLCIGLVVIPAVIVFLYSNSADCGSAARFNGPGVELRTIDFENPSAAVLKPWASVFTLHCSSSLSCINEYLAIDSGGYVYVVAYGWMLPREAEMVFD